MSDTRPMDFPRRSGDAGRRRTQDGRRPGRLRLSLTAKTAPSPKPTLSLTLIRGPQLLSGDGRRAGPPGADLLIAGGRIAAIGDKLAAPEARLIEAQGLIALPGLTNGRVQSWQGLWPEGPPDGFGEALRRHAAAASPDQHRQAALACGRAALAGGVTRLLNHADAQSTPAAALACAQGQIASGVGGWFCWPLDDPAGPAGAQPWRWSVLERLRAAAFSDDSAQVRLAVSIAVTASEATGAAAAVARARRLGVGLIVVRLSVNGDVALQVLDEAGVLGSDVLIDHLAPLSDASLGRLSACGAAVCADVLSRYPYALEAQAWRAIGAGVRTALGSHAPLWVSASGLETMRLAYWNMYRSPLGAAAASCWRASDVIDQAVRLSAQALAPSDPLAGKLAPGARADIILVEPSDDPQTRDLPPAERVAFLSKTQGVELAIVAGKVRLDRRAPRLGDHSLRQRP